jgi:glycosyltransferase involved in cell wall biosynthesis
LKIALVCDWYHPRIGGIERHLQDLAATLVAARHEVVVITPTPGDDRVDGIRVRRISAPRAPRFGFLVTPAGVRAVGNALADERVDVAHCHVSIVSPAAMGGAAQSVGRGVPTVVTFHSVVPQTHLLARAARATLGTATWPARFSAVSERVAREVRAVSPNEMTILANGIDVEAWRMQPAPRSDDTVRLISIMRLNAKKRPLKLVDLMRALNARLPQEKPARLCIVGDGPERARLERAISRYGLGNQIEVAGQRSRSEIRELLASSDVFVLPTLRESFGIAALEARCAGLPVVAMHASGVSSLIEHGLEGLLAESDVELVSHVARLVCDSELRAAISDHNRRTSPPFDWPRTLDAHLAIYREAIALRDSACADMNR